jgi:hypothetical protein
MYTPDQCCCTCISVKPGHFWTAGSASTQSQPDKPPKQCCTAFCNCKECATSSVMGFTSSTGGWQGQHPKPA